MLGTGVDGQHGLWSRLSAWVGGPARAGPRAATHGAAAAHLNGLPPTTTAPVPPPTGAPVLSRGPRIERPGRGARRRPPRRRSRTQSGSRGSVAQDQTRRWEADLAAPARLRLTSRRRRAMMVAATSCSPSRIPAGRRLGSRTSGDTRSTTIARALPVVRDTRGCMAEAIPALLFVDRNLLARQAEEAPPSLAMAHFASRDGALCGDFLQRGRPYVLIVRAPGPRFSLAFRSWTDGRAQRSCATSRVPAAYPPP